MPSESRLLHVSRRVLGHVGGEHVVEAAVLADDHDDVLDRRLAVMSCSPGGGAMPRTGNAGKAWADRDLRRTRSVPMNWRQQPVREA